MTRKRGISLIIALLLVACLAQAAVADTSSLPANTPEVIATPGAEPVVVTAPPVPAITPEPAVTETGTAVNGPVSLSRFRIAPPSHAFLQYLNQESPLTASHPPGGRTLGYIPSPIDLSNLRGAGVSWANVQAQAADSGTDLTLETADIQAGGIPVAYDLRALGRVTGVRDQGDCGSCWAFATYGSLESDLLPSQTWDFSEQNMLNNHFWDMAKCAGGNDAMALAYLTRWAGPVNEKADPYIISAVTSLPGLKVRKHVQDAFYIPGPWSSSTGDYINIKAAIMNYGGVYSLFYWDSASYNAQTSSYYNTPPDWMADYPYLLYPNHAVTLVGWDDNFDPARFPGTPPGRGAFIAKNSWGTGFGDQGYFYVSYYDHNIGKYNLAFTAEPTKNYRHEYQWDELGWTGTGILLGDDGWYTNTAWYASVFTAVDREEVSAVSFYSTDERVDYTASVYTDPADGPVNSAGPRATMSGSLEFAGYHTIKFDTTVPVNAGQRFSVVMKVTNPLSYYTIPVEAQLFTWDPETGEQKPLTSRAVAHQGESYVSHDGLAWEDTAVNEDAAMNSNVCLKAFTVPASPPPDARFTATPKKGKKPLVVSFRDRSLRKPNSWLWDFGDGQTSTDRNPAHTYTTAGTFSVTLTVKNTAGEDSIVKPGLITVTDDTRRARPHVDHVKKNENPEPFDDD